MKSANYDAAVLAGCRMYSMPVPVGELVFAPPRRWRFDYAWKDTKVALEVEGGLFAKGGGRHNRGAGMRGDIEKYNAATVAGWRVIRAMPEQVRDGSAFASLAELMGLEPIESLRQSAGGENGAKEA